MKILSKPDPTAYSDKLVQKKLSLLQNRFQSALRFLKKITITKHGIRIHLNRLPWYLLIGPTKAGKTTLLANSGVNFVLHRQFKNQNSKNLDTSENCDWWVTHDISMIDVPGKYLSSQESTPILWEFFLHLVKQQRGKHGVNGLIIALPLPEMLLKDRSKALATDDIFARIHELQSLFNDTLPCQIILTKCDLLPGFLEFFAESSSEDLNQAFGMTLTQPEQDANRWHDIFTMQFNALIKKTNQQLLWRLHHERSAVARTYIKEFPLQLEHLKQATLNFVNQLAAAHCKLALQGIYLTSAMQEQPQTSNPEPIGSDNAIAVFKEAKLPSRTYFIKQLVARKLADTATQRLPANTIFSNRYFTSAILMSVLALGFVFLGHDFKRGFSQTTAIQHQLTHYRSTVVQIQDLDTHLSKTLALLNSLQEQIAKNHRTSPVTVYSTAAEQHAQALYQQALQTVLVPEIKNYLANYLNTPINKNTENVYATLKAYLMLGDATHLEPEYLINTLQTILTKPLTANMMNDLTRHLTAAINTNWSPQSLDPVVISATRRYLSSLQNPQLGYIILKNSSYSTETDINLGTHTGAQPLFISRQMTDKIASMFTAKTFQTILTQEIHQAAQEVIGGNWVLGYETGKLNDPNIVNALAEQLRTMYVNNYIDVWETLLANIHINKPRNLFATDAIITTLISLSSPLLILLKTVRDNTYFDPVASYSPKLQALGLVTQRIPPRQNALYEIFAGLQGLHQYISTVLNASNEKKAAFAIVSTRMLSHGAPDAITQLRLIADKNPEPIKSWLEDVAHHAWLYLMQDAGHYIDTSWQQQIIHVYQTDLANRYPFSHNAQQEVDINKFTQFFGKPGIALNFYQHYLLPFIDTSTPDWHWKKVDEVEPPFSNDTLRQIKQITHIHQTFFPNGDDKLYVQFALQPYKFDKLIKRVKLNINDKQFTDDTDGEKISHTIAWPSTDFFKATSIQLVMNNHKTIGREFKGTWGWFRLVSQAFETMHNKNEMLLNLSTNQYEAKYLLFTQGSRNPFMSLNLEHFDLPAQLTKQTT